MSDRLRFTGAIRTLALDRKTHDLLVTVAVDPSSGTTHYDMRSWKHQLLDVELRPAGTADIDDSLDGPDATVTPIRPTAPTTTASPINDPVRNAIQDKRVERMLRNFLTDDDTYLEPEA